MKIGITGATGFIGARATALAAKRGWDVVVYSRRRGLDFPGAEVRPFCEGLDASGLDAILHLAGEPILGLWTAEKKARIMSSRVDGTRWVVEGIARAARPPSVLVSGSAVGYYGDTGDRVADESSPAGLGFLSEVTRAWESEAQRAEASGARVVLLRTGFVLGRGGGAMKSILPVFRAGLGGRLGSGHQWMSPIHVDDIARMALWAIENARVRGPINGVMPGPCTNREFTRALASAVHRPAVFPVPAFLLRALFGGMAEVMLGSSRVVPGAALSGGYRYDFSALEGALAEIAGREAV